MRDRVQVVLFDLDETLYSRELGVVGRIDRRINQYLSERLGYDPAQVDDVRRELWSEHGTTLRGLMHRGHVDPDDYLDFVHRIEIDDLLVPDLTLRRALHELPTRRAVLTNASRSHAERVIQRLGLEGCFEIVLALEDLGYVPKPQARAFHIALEQLEIPPTRAILVDDNLANLAGARALGMGTVWVAGERKAPREGAPADLTIREVRRLATEIERMGARFP